MAETVYTPSLSDVGPALKDISKALNRIAEAERTKAAVLQRLCMAILEKHYGDTLIVQAQTDTEELL